jgi:hypothetical protein
MSGRTGTKAQSGSSTSRHPIQFSLHLGNRLSEQPHLVPQGSVSGRAVRARGAFRGCNEPRCQTDGAKQALFPLTLLSDPLLEPHREYRGARAWAERMLPRAERENVRTTPPPSYDQWMALRLAHLSAITTA